jgi:hypothetical protein
MSLIDFYFKPTEKGEYSEEEVNHELISSVKAFHLCQKVAKEFYECRQTPSGRAALPETCLDPGFKLFKCFQYVKKIPKGCQNSYELVKSCLDSGIGNCSDLMTRYVECKPRDLPSF